MLLFTENWLYCCYNLSRLSLLYILLELNIISLCIFIILYNLHDFFLYYKLIMIANYKTNLFIWGIIWGMEKLNSVKSLWMFTNHKIKGCSSLVRDWACILSIFNHNINSINNFRIKNSLTKKLYNYYKIILTNM